MTINGGNSGGGLVSVESGELVGIVNAQIVVPESIPTGIGVAQPVNLIKAHIETARCIPRS